LISGQGINLGEAALDALGPLLIIMGFVATTLSITDPVGRLQKLYLLWRNLVKEYGFKLGVALLYIISCEFRKEYREGEKFNSRNNQDMPRFLASLILPGLKIHFHSSMHRLIRLKQGISLPYSLSSSSPTGITKYSLSSSFLANGSYALAMGEVGFITVWALLGL
jgi:hypothetical protein